MSILVFVLFAGCSPEKNVQTSSITSGEEILGEINSNVSESDEEKASSKIETSSVSEEDSSIETNTSSNHSSAIKRPSKNDKNDTETSSVSSSESVKTYFNPNNLGVMCYSLSMRSTTAMGMSKEKRYNYFKQIVNENYFNQFLLRIDGDLEDNAQIIADAGGSFWLQIGVSSKAAQPDYLPDHLKGLESAVNRIKDAGYGDLLNGFFYDEPFLGNTTLTNSEFASVTKAIYQKFGLRIFAVFSTYEFTGVESNKSVNPDKAVGVVTSPGLKYLTDVGFDAYSTDVRDGATNGGAAKFSEWQNNCSKDIVDGKTFYTEHRKFLEQKVGHKVNFWHFPCAWTDSLWGGLNAATVADEDYWIAHLDFMAQDILNSSNPGGICIYTFRRVDKDTNEAFERHMDLKNEVGGWAVYYDVPKYERYCQKLRQWTGIFSSRSPKLVTELEV